MGNTSNILIGILAMVFGMVMIVWVIPAQTVPALFASVPSGFYANIGCGLMIASGAALAISGVFAGREHIDMALARRQFTVFAMALVLLSVVTLLMPHIGFIPAGILACLMILLLMQVREPIRLVAICAATPVSVWAFFEHVLTRPLP